MPGARRTSAPPCRPHPARSPHRPEGNHNPDHDKWSVNNGLTLRTATATNHLYWARITLTHRIQGPTSTAAIQLWTTRRSATDSNCNTTGTGTEVASANVTGGRIRLRAAADIRPGASRPGTLSHSTSFTRLGPAFTMGHTWQFFTGYRFALSNCASQTLGGSVRIARFALTTPRAQQRSSSASDQLLRPRPATPGRTTPWPVPPSTGQRLTRPQ